MPDRVALLYVFAAGLALVAGLGMAEKRLNAQHPAGAKRLVVAGRRPVLTLHHQAQVHDTPPPSRKAMAAGARESKSQNSFSPLTVDRAAVHWPLIVENLYQSSR